MNKTALLDKIKTLKSELHTLEQMIYKEGQLYERVKLKRYNRDYYLNSNNRAFFLKSGNLCKIPLYITMINEGSDWFKIDNIEFLYEIEKDMCHGITLVFPITELINIMYLDKKQIFSGDLKDAYVILESEDGTMTLKYTVKEFQKKMDKYKYDFDTLSPHETINDFFRQSCIYYE